MTDMESFNFLNYNAKNAGVKDIVVCNDGDIEKADCEISAIPIITFMSRVNNYDFDPPFQRKECWTDQMKGNLIRAILQGKPIPPIYMANKKNNIAHKSIIDGKQRATAIVKFWKGELKIPFQINGITKKLSYNDIIELVSQDDNSQLKNIKEQFEQYNLQLISYKNLNMSEQCDLFGEINTYVPCSNEELVFGQNYFSRQLFGKFIFNKIQCLLRHVNDLKLKDNVREKCTIFIARIAFICFGKDLNDAWAIRELGLGNPKRCKKSKPLNNMICNVNKLLANNIDESQLYFSEIDDQSIKNMSFYKKINLLIKLCNTITDVLEYNNTKAKKIKKNDMHDIVCFFMEKIINQKITLANIEQEKGLMLEFIMKYHDSASQRTSGQSVISKQLENRYQFLEAIFKEVVYPKIDSLPKNKRISQDEQTIALLKSPSRCPIDGSAISDRNGQIDHIDSASIHGATNYSVISNYSNRMKSNISRNFLDEIHQYYECNPTEQD